MTLYHLSVKIIGRGSGRSAVGAAAYRAGEKLRSIGHAAYQSGDKLHSQNDEITHDYTRKQGIVHSEIILPNNAPPEYADRETLWNAVEKAEKRADARLAREIEVALQAEFNLEEQKILLREYIQENFVDKGMIADYAIHNNEGNPHAHIMLTTRNVSLDGFGNKNRDWDNTNELVNWRKNWADINNRLLEEKGIEERIDHRTLRAQGIDREPTIHMGAAAWALEKRGVRTERGERNHEIKRRNRERAERTRTERAKGTHENAANIDEGEDLKKDRATLTKKEIDGVWEKINEEKAAQIKLERLILDDNWGEGRESVKLTVHERKMQARRIAEVEKHLCEEKAAQIVEKMRERREAREAAEIARHMDELEKEYILLDKELNALKSARNEIKQELPQLTYRAENIDEHAQNITILQEKLAQLQAERQRLGLLQGKRKKDIDREIERIGGDKRAAAQYFKNHYHIDPSEAKNEIGRIKKMIDAKKSELQSKDTRIQEITKKLDNIELEYHIQKLINELRPDKLQINKFSEQMKNPPKSVRDKLHYEQIDRRLNTIAEENFHKVVEKLPENQAKILINEHNRAIERERKRQIELERERTQTFDRSR